MTLEVRPWTFAPVEYTKYNDGGNTIPYYRFKVLVAPHDLLTLVSSMVPPSLLSALVDTTLKETEYASYLPDLYKALFANNTKVFTRKYDSVACAKNSAHIFAELPSVTSEDGSYTCVLRPTEVRLMNSKFYIAWSVELAAEIDIDVDSVVPLMEPVKVVGSTTPAVAVAPAFTETIDQSSTNTIDLIELDDIDSDKDESTTESSLPLRSGLTDRQIRERQRVEEARLRAKLAAFRAQRAMDRYIQKYGDLTDSDATEYTDTDADTDYVSD
jgi:hypothetical protein